MTPARPVTLTGANGFLGWHLRAALKANDIDDVRSVAVGESFDLEAATLAVSGAARVIHVAGVNRATDSELRDGNLLFAKQLADAIRRAAEPPLVVVYANSTQSSNDSVYGKAKLAASSVLEAAAVAVGARFENVLLPNLFGEHGRPFYNAVTATFCHVLAQGDTPTIDRDSELTLLHVQDASDVLAGCTLPEELHAHTINESVSGLLARLTRIAKTYRRGEIPDVASDFDRNLFNTYRSFTFPDQVPVRLVRHADERGSFFETVRSHGGIGQSSFSTTEAGISRGDHFHRRKIERFVVLAGSATIALRKFRSAEVYEFEVTGETPAAVDMPTMWAHKITNTGSDTLYTSFWTNEIFNASAPDTIAEAV